MKPTLTIRGFGLYQGYLDGATQSKMIDELRDLLRVAPLFSPETRWGKKMSVQMTSAGKYGWYSDRKGYRYERHHPNGTPWPAIPASILNVWHEITGLARKPDCCLLNLYRESAKMGMHQDKDEADFSWPVVSISLGDDGLFRIGGQERGGKTESVWLKSGDVMLMGGEARLTYHGLDKIRQGSSTLLRDSGRINLTLRVVD